MPRRITDQTLRILNALLEDPAKGRYGLELMESTALASGTAYPILHRLEDEGWLESQAEEIDPHAEGRPRRRLYRLTGLGEIEAKELLEARRRVKQGLPQPLARRKEAPA
jgi:DNA-binding PadR family transcriptional regulator